MIRILIAEDHAVVADGLRRLIELEPDMQVVASVDNGRDAIRVAAEMRPDVVLMNHSMPVMNGVEATTPVREACPDAKVVMLSMSSEPEQVYRALQAGAAAYLSKRSISKDVIDAIRAVRRGERYLSKHLTDGVMERYVFTEPPEDALARLSLRERQVLRMLAESHTVKEIAESLSLSPKTVETYRARLMTKLDVRDLAGLVRFAIRHGLVLLE